MRTTTAATLLLAAVGSIAAPASIESRHVLHERRSLTTSPWQKRERLHGDAKLPMRIGLTQRNLDHGASLLDSLSYPSSASYGKYLSVEEVTDLFAPSTDTVEAVQSWLEAAGIHASRVSQSVNKQWLQFDAKASEAEELFKTNYHLYEHAEHGSSSVACDEYHVPSHIQKHVDYITPGIKFSAISGRKPASSSINKRTSLGRPGGPGSGGPGFGGGSGHGWRPRPPPMQPMPPGLPPTPQLGNNNCTYVATPECIATLYNITKGTSAHPGNELGIFEDLGDIYSQEDLDAFFSNLAPYIPNGTHPQLDAIDGAIAPVARNISGEESALDFQISYPIIWPQQSVLFQTDDYVYENNYTFQGFLNNFLDAIDGSYCSYSAFGETGNSPDDPPYPDPAPGGYKGALQCGVYKPTNVISISYGGTEFDLPMSYQRRQCNEFMKLGLQGVSICVSSGDSGIAARGANGTASNYCYGPNKNLFVPAFPATCPYLTTLGATVLPPGADVHKDQEIAVTRFPSGGGFSNIYPPPNYQKAAVARYFEIDNPSYPSYSCEYNSSACFTNGGFYNRGGRGYPDFSAIGDNVLIYFKGKPVRIGGTSASSPAFASILTRINEERLKIGKSTVGFVNPTLYAHPEVLHDITNGTNPGCGTQGFSAASGWDPVTGLGTPNYPGE
ncbi:hypothetical protein LTR78_007342 [Recurvomyces mirabilis]|uniref:Peptidase S53 domain-containing protein n=1 Tax=Recurvomyces mirabilis TaxID=574656 RepID=A0AAE0WJB7_9PEZI|nr:hypothetical protein LTR78_007342 [Recurvomyces mirabilis]KAK5155071.1 hypothetical protein LTS14_006026 [Recurvomyces mirabilis]